MESRLQRIIFYTCQSLFFAVPLVMFHKTSELFEFNKMLVIYLLTLLIATAWVGRMILLRRVILGRTSLDFPIILFFATQIISTVISIDRHTSFFGYYGRFNGGLLSITSYLILYYGLVSNIDINIKKIERLLRVSVMSSVLVILWGLPGKIGYDLSCLLFTGRLYNGCWTDQFHPELRMFSTIGQPNWLGAYLAILFFIGSYFFLKKHHQQSSGLVYMLYLGLNFSTLLFTRSRSALLSVMTGAAVLFVYLLKNKSLNKKIATQALVLLVIPILLFKIGIVSVDRLISLDFLRQNISPAKKMVAENTSALNITESFDIRKIVWRGAIELGIRYPIFGTGVETFAFAYNYVRPKAHNLTSEWDFIYNKAHNEYLNYFATTGFAGIISYILLIVAILRQAYFVIKSKAQAILGLCLICSWITILITNFFGFSTTTVNIYFYLLPALIFASTLKTPMSEFKPANHNLAVWQKAGFCTIVLAMMFGIIYIGRYFFADMAYVAGENESRAQNYQAAEKNLKRALTIRYEHVYADKLSGVLASRSLFSVIDDNTVDGGINRLINEADEYNKRAIQSSPQNVNYWKTRAKNYYVFYQILESEQAFKQADSALETAKRLAPTDPKLYYTQALLYIAKHEKKTAEIKLVERAKHLLDQAINLKSNYMEAIEVKKTLNAN